AAELELIAHELRDALGGDPGGEDPVPETVHFRGRGTLIVDAARIREVLRNLHARGYRFMASLHGVDYYPDEPRLGVLYDLLDMDSVDRLTVKARVPTDKPELESVVPVWRAADVQEREVYDMFGVVFEGHPDLRRILMPEDYEGYPQRRD